MFSLIITIIAIALAVALALAVIYYGSASTKAAGIRAAADTLLNQSMQINAAGALAVSQGESWPVGKPHFSQPYLAVMPSPPKSAYAEGLSPAPTDWEYLLADGSSHHFVLRDKINKDVCLEVNKLMGFSGIPASWDGTSVIQCYGSGRVISGAYTFIYSPGSATAVQREHAQAQANVEGETSTSGYPRLCADNSVVTEGLCPSGSTTAPEDTGGDSGDPSEDQCVTNPDSADCDLSKFHALRVDNFIGRPGGEVILFTAVEDCSQAIPSGSVCLPAFQSRHRFWQWGTGGQPTTWTTTVVDGNGSASSTKEYGFTITDGTNTYTLQGAEFEGTKDTFIPVNDYPRTALGDGNFSIDCSAAAADIYSRGGQFLPGSCTSIKTKGAYGWTFVYDDIDQFDLRSVNSINLGMYYNDEQTSTEYSLETYASTDTNKLIIGKISRPYTESTPLSVQQGNSGRWPVAPLDTTFGDMGPL